MTTRRSILAGFASLLAAPAIVRVGSLMPVKAYVETPKMYWMGADGFYTISNNLIQAIEEDERDRLIWIKQRDDAMQMMLRA